MTSSMNLVLANPGCCGITAVQTTTTLTQHTLLQADLRQWEICNFSKTRQFTPVSSKPFW